VINPLAAIAAAQMMLETLGEREAGAKVEQGIVNTLTKLKSLSAGKMGYSTSQVGDMVATHVASS
jgi:3-isopropylmalate dehydrogenase